MDVRFRRYDIRAFVYKDVRQRHLKVIEEHPGVDNIEGVWNFKQTYAIVSNVHVDADWGLIWPPTGQVDAKGLVLSGLRPLRFL